MRITGKEIFTEEAQGQIILETLGTSRVTVSGAGDLTVPGALAITGGITNQYGNNATLSRSQILQTARGLITESFPATSISSGTVGTSQTIYFSAIGLKAGDTVTNIVPFITAAASGTAPTSVYAALYSSGGDLIKQTANYAISGQSATLAVSGYATLALTSAYAVTADGLYYAAYLKDGTFGTVDLAIGVGITVQTGVLNAYGSNPRLAATQASQTSMPTSATFADSASLTPLWLGVS